MNTRHKALSAAVALSTALTLTAVPASAAPTTLATALAALRAAEAQVQTAIHDQATLSAAKWDAQMDAALAAEATAEANLRPFLVPPSATDFDVVHLFDYKAHGLTYKVELDPINGSTSAYGNTTNPIDNQISEYGSPVLPQRLRGPKRGLLRDFQCRLGRQRGVEVGRRDRPAHLPSVNVGPWATCAAKRLYHRHRGFDSRFEWPDLSSRF